MRQVFRLAGILGTLLPVLTYAQLLTPPASVGLVGTGATLFANTGILCTGLKWVYTAAIILSILNGLLAGLAYMSSSGDAEKVKVAHRRLIYTAIGVAVAISARTLPVLVATIIRAQGGAGAVNVCSS